jgi:FlaA1/EpsC-like NDP-sugar epimerase
LVARGFSHRRAVVILYIVCCFFGAGALGVTVLSNVEASLILAVVGTAAVIGIRQLRYTEMALLRNGLLLPIYDSQLVNRETFQGLLELGFIVGSLFVARLLTAWSSFGQPVSQDLIITVAIASVIQFSVLWISGLYKGTLRHVGVRDGVRITKSVALAIIATGVVFGFILTPPVEVGFSMLVLDFYLLSTCILGTRFSFRVLKHFSQPDRKDGKRVLLYGAGPYGTLILEKILNGEIPDKSPIGFLDDDPGLEGKNINGYPVYGGHWKLPSLMKRMKVDELLLISKTITPETMKRITLLAEGNGMVLKRVTISLEEAFAARQFPRRRSGSVGSQLPLPS